MVGLTNYHDFAPEGEWHRLIETAAAADEAGIDAISVVDHVALGGDLDTYPYGSFPGGLDTPWLEPLTTLAACAARTRRVRLMTGILIAPLRPAALLAKTAATLDQLSGGRLELGVGTGWLEKEYEAVGLDFAERGRLLDSTIEACRQLWRPGATDFDSPQLSFSGVHCSPGPVREERVPLWIGGDLHRRNLERIVRWEAGWIPSPATRAADIAAGTARLREAFAAAGRDPATLRVRVSVAPRRADDGTANLDSTFRNLRALLESTRATEVFVAHAALNARHDGSEAELFARLARDFAEACR